MTSDTTILLDSLVSIGMARIKFDVNIGKLMQIRKFSQGKKYFKVSDSYCAENFLLILQMKIGSNNEKCSRAL